MDKDVREIFSVALRMWVSAVIAFGMLAAVCLMCGCSARHVPAETVRTEYVRTDSALYLSVVGLMRETERMRRNASDSLIHRIRETTRINAEGDTIDHSLIEYVYMSSKEKAEYERTIEEKNDSIALLKALLSAQRTDSVAVPYPVEKKLTKWESVKMDFGEIALGVMGAVIVGLAVWLAIVKRRR